MNRRLMRTSLFGVLVILVSILSGCVTSSEVLCASYECTDIILVVEIGEEMDETISDSGWIVWEYEYNLIEIVRNNTDDIPESIKLDNLGLGPDYILGTEETAFLPEPNLGDIYVVYVTIFNDELVFFHNVKLDNYDINQIFEDQQDNYRGLILPES